MLPRSRWIFALACTVFVGYLLFWHNVLGLGYGRSSRTIGTGITTKSGEEDASYFELERSTASYIDYHLSRTASAQAGFETGEVGLELGHKRLQNDFEVDNVALGLKDSAGKIFGNTINHLVQIGGHAGFAAQHLTPASSPIEYTRAPFYKYSPYPTYNDRAWNVTNQGSYYKCPVPFGGIEDIRTVSGHHEIFKDGMMGSYVPLDIDSNLCFEREGRLGPYGFNENDKEGTFDGTIKDTRVWDKIDWGSLQSNCVDLNKDRYAKANMVETTATRDEKNATASVNRIKAARSHRGIPAKSAQVESRTAFLIRTNSSQKFQENDKQNIRALITELSLRSGGEYQVFLIVDVLDGSLPIFTKIEAYESALSSFVPIEFQNITILYNSAIMHEAYPPLKNIDQEDEYWLIVQRFSQEYPEFEYVWNWNLQTRYTGHYYNLFEKISNFAKQQPRKGLWERNERFYVPEIHFPYRSRFRKYVNDIYGPDIFWGAPEVEDIVPVGERPPVEDPTDEDYKWGIGEEADFISLSPIFNPVDTIWNSKISIRGFRKDIPRRVAIGGQVRMSRKLLGLMHENDLEGNHLTKEMAPSTLALLHRLKPAFAPIPIWFDREWSGERLEKFFNPGERKDSGGSGSAFGPATGGRFEGASWGTRGGIGTELYDAWLGRDANGWGGTKWEKENGRVCLPPLLLSLFEDKGRHRYSS